MSDYTFRGQPISGAGAYALLNAIKRVMTECPNPTLEDILVLDEIVKDFQAKVEQALYDERDYYDDELDR